MAPEPVLQAIAEIRTFFSRVQPLVGLAEPFIDKKGKKRFTGNRQALKRSQEYPRPFCIRAAVLIEERMGFA